MRIPVKLFFCIAVSSVFYSCRTSFPVSGYAKYNEITNSWLYFYSNDSLGISIDFNGRQKISENFTKPVIEKKAKQLLRSVINERKANLFYASKPTGRHFGRYFGHRLYGFVLNGTNGLKFTNRNVKITSLNGAVYYADTANLIIKKQWRFYPILVNAKNKNLLFVWLKEMDTKWSAEEVKQEERLFMINTGDDFSTLSAGGNYKLWKQKKDSLFRKIDNLVKTRKYISPLSAFGKIDEDSVGNFGLWSFFYQMKATAYSFTDDLQAVKEANLQSFSGSKRIGNKEVADSLVFSVQVKDSINALAKQAQVLMFNESHYDWRNRWLLTLMLPELKKQGYKYLCMEALSSGDSSNIRGFPALKDGVYIKEPFMGNLLRTAINLGFKIVAYEDTIADHNTIDERERAQAKNLYSQFKNDPNAKWVVLAGYGHINKNGFSQGQPSMIQYFQKLCRKDVKCIDQTTYSPLFNNDMSTGYSTKGYFVVSDPKKRDSGADIFILSNLESFPYEDIDTGKERGFTRYSLNDRIKPVAESPGYLFVYVQDEYLKEKESAIPVFIKKIKELKTDYLFLPENKYLFLRIDNDEKEF